MHNANERLQTTFLPRKAAPAPIRIPNAAIHGPKVQIQRSDTVDSNTELKANSQPPTDSPGSIGDMSALSGTTLARALFANSFILSDPRVSHHRSGTSVNVRQDSATLPGMEDSFLTSPYWRDKRISSGDIILTPNSSRDSHVPPVPPLPSGSSLLKISRSVGSSGAESEIQKVRRRSGAELTRSVSNSSQRSHRKSGSESVLSHVRSSGSPTSERSASRRISRIVEVPSPISSAPGTPIETHSHKDILNANSSVSPMSQQISSSEGTSPLDYDVPTPSPDFETGPPRRHSQSDTSLTPGSAQSVTVANVLDDYLHVSSAESRTALSPMASESSASITAPTPYRTAPKRMSKKRKESKVVLSANSTSVAAGKGKIHSFLQIFILVLYFTSRSCGLGSEEDI